MTARARAWSVYLVRRVDGALYCGIAQDVKARLAKHEAGRGSKALRGRGPLEVVFRRRIGTRAEAQSVEAAIKRCSKADKERLASSSAFARSWFRTFRTQRLAIPRAAMRSTDVEASSMPFHATPCT